MSVIPATPGMGDRKAPSATAAGGVNVGPLQPVRSHSPAGSAGLQQPFGLVSNDAFVAPQQKVRIQFGNHVGEGATPEEAKQPIRVATRNEVLQHEMDHLSAAGPIAVGGPNLYQDSNGFTVAGDVQVKFGFNPAKPHESLRDARLAYASALAPDQPSTQDIAVSQKALAIMAQAQNVIKQQETLGYGSMRNGTALATSAGGRNTLGFA